MTRMERSWLPKEDGLSRLICVQISLTLMSWSDVFFRRVAHPSISFDQILYLYAIKVETRIFNSLLSISFVVASCEEFARFF